jgi:hypothetical protein
MDTPRTRDVGICTMPLALDRPKTPVRGYTLSLSGNSQFRHERCFFQGGASRRTDRLRLTSRAPQPNESSTTGTRNERQPEPAGRGASGYRRRQRDGRRHVAPRPGHGDATLVRPAAGVGRRPRGAAPCSPRRWGCTGRRFLASCPLYDLPREDSAETIPEAGSTASPGSKTTSSTSSALLRWLPSSVGVARRQVPAPMLSRVMATRQLNEVLLCYRYC